MAVRRNATYLGRLSWTERRFLRKKTCEEPEQNYWIASSFYCSSSQGRSASRCRTPLGCRHFKRGRAMSTVIISHDAMLRQIKVISGRRIEGERRRRFLTQRQFSTQAGISVRWLREIESGNPGVKLDDHLTCASVLGLAPSYIFLPVLCQTHGKRFSIDQLNVDLADFERSCLQLLARRTHRQRVLQASVML